MKRLVLLLAAISLVGFFSACGQSGPLYLPGNPSKLETVAPAPDDDEEAPQDGEDDEDDEGG